MIKKSHALLFLLFLASYICQSQTTRRYGPEKKSKVSPAESVFTREIKKIEHAGAFARFDINSLITANAQPLEQLSIESDKSFLRKIRQASFPPDDVSPLREEQNIDGQPWNVSTKYINRGKMQFSFDDNSREYELIEVVLTKALVQSDTSDKFTSIEKIFYWRAQDEDYDFAMSYKEYRLGKLKQEGKQIYAGKDQLSLFNNLANSNSKAGRVTGNSEQTSFEIYPNPTNRGEVSLSFNAAKAGTPVTIIVYDITGRPIGTFNRNAANAGSSILTLDIGRHPAGVYTVQLSHDGVSAIQKLVITQ